MNKEQYKTYLRQRLYEEHSDNVSTGVHTEFTGTP